MCSHGQKTPPKPRPRPSAISAMPPPGRAVALWLRRGRVVLGRAGACGLPGTLRAAAATRGAAEVSAACGPGGGSPPRADPAPPGPPARGLFPRRGRRARPREDEAAWGSPCKGARFRRARRRLPGPATDLPGYPGHVPSPPRSLAPHLLEERPWPRCL